MVNFYFLKTMCGVEYIKNLKALNRLPCDTKFYLRVNFADRGFILNFAGTNFCDSERLVYRVGYQFLRFPESRLI